MFYENADADRMPQKVTIEDLPDGKRAVRLTSNVQECCQEESEQKHYRFEEVEFILPASQTTASEEIEAEFERWWEYGKTVQTQDAMTQTELSDAVRALQKDNAALQAQNTMLESCLLEMSELVYA